jgi:uncharacterized glyoxalase superfamily protein PhnB/uncharacterized protein YndB with AHSA1/START domain
MRKQEFAMQLNPYLFFNGTCREAFELYAQVLGGRIEAMLTHRETPAASGVPAGWQDKIIHARMMLSSGPLMASDAPPAHFQAPQGFSVNISVADPAEAERVFHALAEGGKVTMPIAKTFWAVRFGMLVDRFGIPWMVNCESTEKAASEAASPAASEEFVISRTFKAPREKVFAAFTDAQRMKRWWGPKGFKVVTSKMSLRPGGTYHYCLRAPDGSDVWGKFVYREIVRPERVVLVSSFSDSKGGVTRHPMAPDWPLHMLSTFLFAEHVGATTFTVRWSPLDANPAERASFEAGRAGMQQGWTGTLDQLEAYLAKA